MKRYGRKIQSIIILLIYISMMLSGCGLNTVGVSDNEPFAEAQEKDMILVGFSQLGSESVWRSANSLSIQNALDEEHGYFLQFNNARQKQENQIKAIRSFISQRVSYIAFSPVTQDGWEIVLKEAQDAGIPVILVDRTISLSNEELYTAWVGSDSREEGERAGYWLEEYLKEKNVSDTQDINIVVMQGTIGSSAQLGRTMGFDSVADRHKNWHILEQTSGEFTNAKAKEVMLDMLEKYDKIDVIVSQNDDMTFGIMDILDEARYPYGEGTDTCLISFDGCKTALELVRDGKINADVECNPNQGEYLRNIIEKLERGEAVEKRNYVEETIFTKENVERYIEDRTY